MVPIHDTDVAEERWSQSSWRNFELWEKLEVRLRRQRGWMVVLAVVLFLIASAIPVIQDQWSAWRSTHQARHLAEWVLTLRTQASLRRQALRVWQQTDGLHAEFRSGCDSGASVFETRAPWSPNASGIQLFTWPESASEWCLNPVGFAPGADVPSVGFSIGPSEDVEAGRVDRLAWVWIEKETVRISSD